MDGIHDHLVDRYVYAVTRRLPTAQREDVSMELHSLIDEMGQACPEDPQPVATVLMELGDPAELADRYRGVQRHLIGPGYFDFYILVLKIVGFAVGLGIVIPLAIGFAFDPPESVGSIIENMVGTLFAAYAQAFAWVTATFAIMEWNQRRLGKSERLEQWSLDDLPDIPQKSTIIPHSEPIVSLVFLVVFFAILNASTWLLKVTRIENYTHFINPFVPEVFKRVLILFNLTIAIAMGIEFAKLYGGVQTKRLALLTLGLKLVSLCISLYIVAGSGIWNPDFAIQMAQVFGEGTGANPFFRKFWNNLPTLLVVVMIFGYVVGTIQTVWRTWNLKIPEK